MRYCEFHSSALEFNLRKKGFEHQFIPKELATIHDAFEYSNAKRNYLENIKHRLFNLPTYFFMFGVGEEIHRFEDAVIQGRFCFKLKCEGAINVFYELLIYDYLGKYYGMLDKQGWVTLIEFDKLDEVLCFIPEIYEYHHRVKIEDDQGNIDEGYVNEESLLIGISNGKAQVYDYEAFYLKLLGIAYEGLKGGQA